MLVQMQFDHCENELLVGIFDFSIYIFSYFEFTSTLTSIAHVKPSGCLLSETCNIIKVLHVFLRGHVEAILAIVGHSYYPLSSMDFMKSIWKGNYCAFLMILNVAEARSANRCQQNCQFEQGFCMFFLFLRESDSYLIRI